MWEHCTSPPAGPRLYSANGGRLGTYCRPGDGRRNGLPTWTLWLSLPQSSHIRWTCRAVQTVWTKAQIRLCVCVCVGGIISVKLSLHFSLHSSSFHSLQGYVYFILTGICHNKVPLLSLRNGPGWCFISTPVETYYNVTDIETAALKGFLCQYDSTLIMFCVFSFIWEQWMSTSWYHSAVWNTFFITGPPLLHIGLQHVVNET